MSDDDVSVLPWLLDTDPALRWQVERDIALAPEEVWRATRARVATEGFGARLLALQDEDGSWGGGAHFPTRKDERALRVEGEEDAQPWTATSWSLTALREWGVDAEALEGTAEKIAENLRWEYEDRPFWEGEVDACINASTLANGAWLGTDVSPLVAWFAEHQLEDGGWNCEWVEGSTRSSFHSTLNALRGILWWETATGRNDLRRTRLRGEEYLLRRRLTVSHTTGELVGPWVEHLAYPSRWVYSSLHALDYFRAASLHDRIAPDPRLADAIALLRESRGADGRWSSNVRYTGERWFEVDVDKGEPSPWLTFLATRVLEWWDLPDHQEER